MTRWLAVALLLVAASCGRNADPLKRIDEAGYARLIAENRGKVVYVDFWATWCDPCREEMPFLVRLAAEHEASGFKLITISADEPEQEGAVRQFAAQQRIPPPACIKRAENNERFINSIDPKWSGALPAGFLYDRQGRKVRSFIGETDPAALEQAITKLL